jgi:benzoyl-CoA reductase/2-hydroxyglutaryl-CoA dehydratase subunit BcrC/BadD/HgdB
MNYPMARHGRGSADAYISECISVARDYKADAVVFAGNTGCKYNWATAQLVKDTIYDELGIPTLCFELSPFDSRILSFEGVKAKFEQFLELVL